MLCLVEGTKTSHAAKRIYPRDESMGHSVGFALRHQAKCLQPHACRLSTACLLGGGRRWPHPTYATAGLRRNEYSATGQSGRGTEPGVTRHARRYPLKILKNLPGHVCPS